MLKSRVASELLGKGSPAVSTVAQSMDEDDSSRVFGNGINDEALKSYCCAHIVVSVVDEAKDARKEKKEAGEHDFVTLPQHAAIKAADEIS